MKKSKYQLLAPAFLPLLLLAATVQAPAQNQQNANQNRGSASSNQSQDESSLTGKVISSTRNTVVIRLDDGSYRLFALDQDTARPPRLAVGARVRVASSAGDEAGYRVATRVTVEQEAAATPARTAGATTSGSANEDTDVPPSMRRLERDIERNVREYRMGVSAGVGLAPEVILIGVHAQFGPVFNSNVIFRPGVDFGWGELSTLFSINPDFLYRLPVSARNGRWSAYAGAGPGFTFLEQSLHTADGDRHIDFGAFHSSTGLNIIGGLQYRSGMFAELRTSVYAQPAPTLRLVIGYNF